MTRVNNSPGQIQPNSLQQQEKVKRDDLSFSMVRTNRFDDRQRQLSVKLGGMEISLVSFAHAFMPNEAALEREMNETLDGLMKNENFKKDINKMVALSEKTGLSDNEKKELKKLQLKIQTGIKQKFLTRANKVAGEVKRSAMSNDYGHEDAMAGLQNRLPSSLVYANNVHAAAQAEGERIDAMLRGDIPFRNSSDYEGHMNQSMWRHTQVPIDPNAGLAPPPKPRTPERGPIRPQTEEEESLSLQWRSTENNGLSPSKQVGAVGSSWDSELGGMILEMPLKDDNGNITSVRATKKFFSPDGNYFYELESFKQSPEGMLHRAQRSRELARREAMKASLPERMAKRAERAERRHQLRLQKAQRANELRMARLGITPQSNGQQGSNLSTPVVSNMPEPPGSTLTASNIGLMSSNSIPTTPWDQGSSTEGYSWLSDSENKDSNFSWIG